MSPFHRAARPTVRVMIAALLTSGLAACSAGASDHAGHDDVLDVVGQFEVHSIEPTTAAGVFTRLGAVETLVTVDAEGEMRPGLATGWSTEDGRVWRFQLREGATFHDGTAVTAKAAAAALTTALETGASTLTEAGVKRISADGNDVIVTLGEAFGPLPAVLAHTSAQILAPASYDKAGKVTKVIGSGPYEVTDVEIPSRVDLAASEHWDGPAPAIDTVEYQVVSRAENRALMVESGQADIALGMDPTSLQRLRKSDAVRIESALLPRTIVLKLNAADPLLADVRVREALSLALDREGIATAVLREQEIAADQLFPPTLEGWHQEEIEPLTHDVERARTLLEDAGFTPGEDGTLARDGKPLTLSLLTFPDRPELPLIAAAIQEQLAGIGVEVDVQVENSSEIPLRHQNGTLQLALFARGLALIPDPTVTLLGDYPKEGGDWGAMGWHDEKLLAALGRLKAPEATDEEVARDRREVATRLQEGLPTVPVVWYRQSLVIGEQVSDVELDPFEQDWHLDEVSWK